MGILISSGGTMTYTARAIPSPATKDAKDIETGVTKGYANPIQIDIDRLQALCNEKVQVGLDNNQVYSHLIIYLQQFTAGAGLNLTTQQASVLVQLVQDGNAKGFVSTKTAILSRLK